MNELLNILLGDRPLLVTPEGYRQAAVPLVPLIAVGENPAAKPLGTVKQPMQFFFGEPPTYSAETKKALAQLRLQLPLTEQGEDIFPMTDDFSDDSLPTDTVAYHRVWSFITGSSRYYFSSKQLEQDVLAAEDNPKISAHLLHINSAGGEAWYLDRLSETLRQAKKPIVTLCEGTMCSAAYYIGCHGQKVYATTLSDFVGSIGTMTSFHDYEGWYEQMGVKLIEARATQSDLKNKMADDLVKGKPEQYVHDVLDPINDAFLAEVKAMRPALAKMDADHPVLRGEVYLATRACQVGLIDDTSKLLYVLIELRSMVNNRRQIDSILDAI